MDETEDKVWNGSWATPHPNSEGLQKHGWQRSKDMGILGMRVLSNSAWLGRPATVRGAMYMRLGVNQIMSHEHMMQSTYVRWPPAEQQLACCFVSTDVRTALQTVSHAWLHWQQATSRAHHGRSSQQQLPSSLQSIREAL